MLNRQIEPHTDIIVKGQRDVQYGHKINLATQADGFVTYLNIESGNPSDKSLYLPVLDASAADYGKVPIETVADGGYASQNNVSKGRGNGVDRVVFNKRCGLGFHDMGVKKKTFERLRDFRAGVEGNISELKRAYKMSKATVLSVEPTLSSLQAKVFTPTCSGCHSGNGKTLPGIMDLTTAQNTYDALVNTPSLQVPELMRVSISDVSGSYLVNKITGTNHKGSRMPFRGIPLDTVVKDGIRQWIGNGANP